MNNLVILIPVALGLGAVGLVAFLWALKSGQYEDLDGAAERVLLDDDDRPLPDPERRTSTRWVDAGRQAHDNRSGKR